MKSIKNKIMAFAIIATLIPSIALGFLSFLKNEALISDNVTRELHALASNVGRELDLWVNENIHNVRAISVTNLVISNLSTAHQNRPLTNNNANTQEVLTHFLQSVQGKLNTILDLTVADANGQVIASSALDATFTDELENWLQNNALVEGVIESSLRWNSQHNTASFKVVYPILSYDEAFIGSLIATLDLGSLKKNLRNTFSPNLGEITLLDQKGRVLLSVNKQADHSTTLDSELLQQLLTKNGESFTFSGLTYPKVIGLVNASKELPVNVVVERDYSEVYAAWVRFRDFFLGLVGFLIIIVAVVAFYIGRSIVMPLESLISATKRIVNGELNVRVDVKQNDEVGQLASIFNQMTDRLHQNNLEITAANEAMHQQNLLLKTLSVTDSLTGLYNRNKLDSILGEQLARFERYKRPFSILMIDVDYFKTLNDSLGHIAGDKILIAVAKTLSKSIRSIDFAVRYGGDEFVVILTETTAEAAIKTAERIRLQVAEASGTIQESDTIALTLSIGVVQSQVDDENPTMLLIRADNALYQAKKAGRDRVHCVHEQ